MRKKISFILLTTLFLGVFSGCGAQQDAVDDSVSEREDSGNSSLEGAEKDIIRDTDAYLGYFEEDIADVTVTCLSGTQDCYRLENNVLTFTEVKADSVYVVSGKLKGSVIVDIGDDYTFDLQMQDFSLVSDTDNPVVIKSGDNVSIVANEGTKNYIYDTRDIVDDADETAFSGAIHSSVDLEICGTGSLTVVSEHNNGIHSKDDLKVEDLTLFVTCMDNALKGNDSVKLIHGMSTLIAAEGDGIKTTNSDISDKGNQRGTVTISAGEHTIYAARDGIDAAYDVIIENDATKLYIYTDKYCNTSSETENTGENNNDVLKTSSGTAESEVPEPFDKMENFENENGMEKQNGMHKPDNIVTDGVPESRGGIGSDRKNDMKIHGRPGGMGGRNDGNTEKAEYSAKGIKADNEITIAAGTIMIQSYDDAIHANADSELENGKNPTGNVTISGGTITAYSDDDGIHADGTVSITDGTVSVTHSYEGIEGTKVMISGGDISVIASDDGINATATADTAMEISGGTIYVNCTGDGLDSNSRTAYRGIVFSGGKTVIISNSGGDSAIDTEQGYQYTGGLVLAVMPARGMVNEIIHCENFTDVAVKSTLSLQQGDYLTVKQENEIVTAVEMPETISAMAVYLGSKDVTLETANTVDIELNEHRVFWAER